MKHPSAHVPPQDVEAEQNVLGAMMVAAPTLTRVIDEVQLSAQDFFYCKKHGAIYKAIRALYTSGRPVDPLSVTDALKMVEKLDEAGGKHYVYELADKVAAAANAKHYAEIVKRHSLTRKRIEIGQRLSDPALNGDAAQLVSELAEVVSQPLADGLGVADRFTDGASFILDTPEKVTALWGKNGDVLHAAGEPLLIVAPPGCGKTTIAQQYALGQVGVPDRAELLGLPITRPEGVVVYVASDRPSQAARSFRRMVSEADRDLLEDRLQVWRGPLPFDLASEPHMLTPFLKARGAGSVIIDSLGATSFDLASDEGGSRVFASLSDATAEGIEVVALHHDRKREQGSDKVRGLDDVYGSRWITAAAGSVVYLDGKAGDLVLKARHLKQPAEEVGPMEIRHDHISGRTVINEGVDLLVAAVNGITVKEAAQCIFDQPEPDKNEIEKARRKLEKHANYGELERLPTELGQSARYRTVFVG
jgi:replicative DNA helicase